MDRRCGVYARVRACARVCVPYPANRVHFTIPSDIPSQYAPYVDVTTPSPFTGPLWVAGDNALYFTDTITATIYKLPVPPSDGGGAAQPAQPAQPHVIDAGGYDGSNCANYERLAEPGSNGMALDGTGHAIICQHPTARIIRVRLSDIPPKTPFYQTNFAVVASSPPGGKARRFNSPNDVVVHPVDGSVWFTDPIYGMLEKDKFCDELKDGRSYLDEASVARGAGCKGVYRVAAGPVAAAADAGEGGDEVAPAYSPATLMSTALHRPNGLAFSPDGKTLYVADSVLGCPSWTGFPVLNNNTLGAATVVLNRASLNYTLGSIDGSGMPPPATEGVADGFKVDAAGRIWSSSPNGLVVIDPAARTVIAEVIFGTNISNVWFGAGGDVWVTGLGHVWKLHRKL